MRICLFESTSFHFLGEFRGPKCEISIFGGNSPYVYLLIQTALCVTPKQKTHFYLVVVVVVGGVQCTSCLIFSVMAQFVNKFLLDVSKNKSVFVAISKLYKLGLVIICNPLVWIALLSSLQCNTHFQYHTQ